MDRILIIAVNWFAEILILLLCLRAILSWFAADPYSGPGKAYRVLVSLTEPYVSPCRQLLFKFGLNTGMLDFSVLISFFMIRILQRIITMLIAIIL